MADVSSVRDEAAKLVERGKLDKAIELYEQLEEAEPNQPQWPKRIGETFRRMGDGNAAVAAFERAVNKYVKTGFLVQAIAVCKLILQVDPGHVATVTRLAQLAAPKPPTPVAPPVVSFTSQIPRARTEPGVGGEAPEVRHSAAVRAATTPGIGTEAPSVDVNFEDSAAAPLPTAPPPRPTTTRLGTAPGTPPPAKPAQRPPPAKPAQRPPPPPQHTRRIRQVTLPPGGALDVLDLSTVVPRAKRLTNSDGSESGIVLLEIDVPFEELEFVEDAHRHSSGEIPVEVDLEPRLAATDPAARRALRETPLFAQLPARTLERLIERMQLVELAQGEVLFREGEQGACLYVVSEGEVTVESAGQALATLGPSAFFGEIALVTELPRSATVRAGTRVELLAIDREVVRDASAESPEVVNVLLRCVRDRLVDKMIKTSPLFAPFADADRAELSSRFELVEVVPGAPLIIEGQRADGLYVLVAGHVEVVKKGELKPRATLTSGDVFGEVSLLSNRGSIATARAATRVLALRMPSRTFQEVIMTHPQVLAYVGDLSLQRSAASEAFVDRHLDLV